MNTGRKFLFAAVLPILLVSTAQAQPSNELNENCTVSVLNRNVQVKADGTWILPVVPAGFGPVRARATCVENGITRSGESALFTVPSNGSVNVPRITLGTTTPIPDLITLTTPAPTLRAAGATTQLTVVASYPGGSVRNVTASSTGTVFTVSNSALASINAEGLVTARTSGTALIQASNEGASGILAITVVLSNDSDGDGILDDIELREGLNPNNPTDAFEDRDLDGLTNLEEVRAGTFLGNPDSDADGLLDGEEATAGADGFVTSPLLADTDGDGIRDGLEITSGSDPTNASSINLAGALATVELGPPAFNLMVNTINPEAFLQLSFRGNLRDGTTIDLTSSVRGTTYSSSNLGVCNFGSIDGRVHASAEGTCTIGATNSGFTASSTGMVRNFTPFAVSGLQIPGFANNVDASDDYAYVAAGAAGLVIVDVSNQTAPVIVATLDTSGNANDVRVVGRYAYVADGAAGLKIIDVVDPSQPVLTGSLTTPGDASDVMVVDDFAYLASGPAGLVIVNCSNPGSPILSGQYNTPGYARGVDVAGTIALIADDDVPSLQVINITNPGAPTLAGSLPLQGQLKDVRARDNIAYVSAYTGGLHAVDFSNPASPVRVGGVPGSSENGFMPFDAEPAERFVLAADVLFVNAVPIAFLQTPSTPIYRGLIDFSVYGDPNGTGVAVAGPFVFMTAAFAIEDNGTSGTTFLFIGQFLPRQDLAGIPPQIAITSPSAGETHYQGGTVTVRADASDDVAVSYVTFSIDGQPVFTDTAAPYEYVLQLPSNATSIAIAAVAADLAGNTATATFNLIVTPDPLTTVSGMVVDDAGAPLPGATVTTLIDHTATAGTGGAFSIFNVPATRGDIVVTASYVRSDGITLTGSSAATAPVFEGVTNVGTITAVEARFETAYGSPIPRCDDCSFNYVLPFAFPFNGTTYSSVLVGTNGYLTFVQGDNTFSESVSWFRALRRIAPFFDDLDPRVGGGMFVNASLPGRFVVTWDRVPQYSFGGSNTIQVTLHSDGKIEFGYRGITSINSGTIVGVNPAPNGVLQEVNYSDQPNFVLPGGTGVYEYFLGSSLKLFDLDNANVLFTPQGDGSYMVRTVLPPAPTETLTITGGPEASGNALMSIAAHSTPQANGAFGKAEVEVLSSGNVRYRGLTNTDELGRFSISGVPPGAIVITVRKKDKVIAQGSLIARRNSDPKHVHIKNPEKKKKSNP